MCVLVLLENIKLLRRTSFYLLIVFNLSYKPIQSNELIKKSLKPNNIDVFKSIHGQTWMDILKTCKKNTFWQRKLGQTKTRIFPSTVSEKTSKRRKTAKLPWHHNLEKLCFHVFRGDWSLGQSFLTTLQQSTCDDNQNKLFAEFQQH